MSDPATDNLRQRLYFLRNAAPREFEAFYAAINAYAGSKLSLVTGVSPENLQQFQGQMQGLEQILIFLKDSVTKPTD